MTDEKFIKNAVLVFGGILFAWILFNYNILYDLCKVIYAITFPFLLGIALAFLMNLVLRPIEKYTKIILKKFNVKARIGFVRGFSIIATISVIIIVIVSACIIVIPEILNTIDTINDQIPIIAKDADIYFNQVIKDNPELSNVINGLSLDIDLYIDQASKWLQSIGADILVNSLSFATSLFSGIFNAFLAFAFACYILMGKENLKRQSNKVLSAFLNDERRLKIKGFINLCDDTFSNFFTGQCLEAIILGTMFFIGMTIFKYPYALLIGVLVSITALIPIFGAFIACGVGAFLMFFIDPIMSFTFIIFFIVIQQIEGNFIYPKVVGNKIGLPAIWVLFAVTLGSALMGIVGMIIFIPMISIIYTLFKNRVNKNLKNKTIDNDQLELTK